MMSSTQALVGILGMAAITVITRGFFLLSEREWPLPAWLMLLYWFGLQVVMALAGGASGSGVAVMAQIGGFVTGALLVPLFKSRRRVAARSYQRHRLHPDHP